MGWLSAGCSKDDETNCNGIIARLPRTTACVNTVHTEQYISVRSGVAYYTTYSQYEVSIRATSYKIIDQEEETKDCELFELK
jgi:hypothetical protein